MTEIQSSSPEELLGSLNEVERKNAPARLYYLGDASLLEPRLRISVVGTRKPTELGVERGRSLVGMLVSQGAIVVSGLAEGVDAVAHESAIAAGGRTIAVLGSGLDKPFPPANVALFGRIAREHLAISQFAPGVPPRKENFPQRNRTMALLSDATIIVEAGEGSGTLHQGWEALRLGRALFLLESLAVSDELTWPKEMLKFGAQVLTREGVGAALESIPIRARGEVTF